MGATVQTDALRTVADWLHGLPEEVVGSVEVRPDGSASIHLEIAAHQPDPPGALLALAARMPAARLEVDPEVTRLSAGRYGRMVRLLPRVPGMQVTVWCYHVAHAPRLAAVAR